MLRSDGVVVITYERVCRSFDASNSLFILNYSIRQNKSVLTSGKFGLFGCLGWQNLHSYDGALSRLDLAILFTFLFFWITLPSFSPCILEFSKSGGL